MLIDELKKELSEATEEITKLRVELQDMTARAERHQQRAHDAERLLMDTEHLANDILAPELEAEKEARGRAEENLTLQENISRQLRERQYEYDYVTANRARELISQIVILQSEVDKYDYTHREKRGFIRSIGAIADKLDMLLSTAKFHKQPEDHIQF